MKTQFQIWQKAAKSVAEMEKGNNSQLVRVT